MILVDVFVPAIDIVYDFSLDENVKISLIVEELIEMVERREQTSFAGDRTKVVLINKGTQEMLPKESTLKECSVATGSNLLLI